MKVSVIPSLISREVIESVDIADPTGPLEVEIRDDQKVLWINDGNSMCIVRICGITGGVRVSKARSGCQCEHEDHINEEHRVPATSKAKLIYGTYLLCEDCDTKHYNDGDRVAPSEPL